MAKQEKKLTGWIDGDLKPVRVGFYQRNWGSRLTYKPDYWNGEVWLLGGEKRIVPVNPIISLIQDRPWRGLARRPR